MRLNAFPLLVAGASLVQYATASPIRVVVVTHNQEVSTNIQYDNGRPFIAEIVRPIALPGHPDMPHVEQGAGRQHPCSKMRDKALALSNKFRQTFGLPLIAEPPMFKPDVSMEEMKILPFIGTPVDYSARPHVPFERVPTVQQYAAGRVMGGYRHHRHMPFLHRVHRALMVLGPWEGRAVAFVLGCGIGVLLRMFWVMTILLFRTFRSSDRSDDADVQDVLVFEADAEDILVPPPQYTDEKVALVAESDNKA